MKRHAAHSSLARHTSRGFTFVELIISIVVIGIAVTGVLLVYTETVARSADPLIRAQALAIAESYLDEIITKHYDDPAGADGEATRDQYDDVDDYDGFSGAPSRPDGSTAGLAGLADYLVTVNVSDGSGALGVAALRVDVTVTHSPTGIAMSLWSYRTDYGP
ncbi:MAG TPA: type II secretion system protein [Gammaproteobacteria bacterium]